MRTDITITWAGDLDLPTLDEVYLAHAKSVLDAHDGNKSQAAKALGIDRRSLYRLLDKMKASTPPEVQP